MKKYLLTATLLLPLSAMAQETLNIYGPGGPAPALQASAKQFQEKYGVTVNVTFGPPAKWQAKAKQNADLIFSGSEIMLHQLKKDFNLTNNTALYLRPVSILVRKDNPKGIHGINSLLKEPVKIIVVNGAGQSGLWEDVIGRTGNIADINNINHKIAFYANNSAEAVKKWQEDTSIDAMIIWNHWYYNLKDSADLIPVEPQFRIYRPVSIAYTPAGINNKKAKEFIAFLSSNEAKTIFDSYGWKTTWNVTK